MSLIIVLVSVSSCGRGSLGGNYCDIYLPIYMADEDTEETKKQIDNNNIVWLELCSEKN